MVHQDSQEFSYNKRNLLLSPSVLVTQARDHALVAVAFETINVSAAGIILCELDNVGYTECGAVTARTGWLISPHNANGLDEAMPAVDEAAYGYCWFAKCGQVNSF